MKTLPLIAALAGPTLSPGQAQAATAAECYDPANAQTVGQAGWTGCEGMYIVKDRDELLAEVSDDFQVTVGATNYTFGDGPNRIFTGQVTDMNGLFLFSAFNDDIGYWDTSNVTDMSSMFVAAPAFNQDIGGWDTSSVTDMLQMFAEASAFNQDLSAWNVALIPSKPGLFDTNATAWTNDPAWRPQWGTRGTTLLTSVTSPDANGAYGIGDVIAIDVVFNQPVAIFDPGSAGPLELRLETGATDQVAVYVSGSGTSKLRFEYTVANGDNSADLDYASTGALELNGLEIRNGSATVAANPRHDRVTGSEQGHHHRHRPPDGRNLRPHAHWGREYHSYAHLLGARHRPCRNRHHRHRRHCRGKLACGRRRHLYRRHRPRSGQSGSGLTRGPYG